MMLPTAESHRSPLLADIVAKVENGHFSVVLSRLQSSEQAARPCNCTPAVVVDWSKFPAMQDYAPPNSVYPRHEAVISKKQYNFA
jgi:hypothetical protein